MCAQCLKNICHLEYSNKFLFSNTYFNTKIMRNKIFTTEAYNHSTSQTVTMPVLFSSRTFLEPKTSASGKSG